MTTSPNNTSSRFCSGLPWTRLVTSAAILGSSSTAMTFLAFSRIFTVRLPVPGPTSSTICICISLKLKLVGGRREEGTSLCLRSALSTIACATPGFLSTCCPKSVFILKTLLATLAFVGPCAYGLLDAAPLRFFCGPFGILVLTDRLLLTSFLCLFYPFTDELEDNCAGDRICRSELTTTLVNFDIATEEIPPYTESILRSRLKIFIETLVHIVIPLVIVTE